MASAADLFGQVISYAVLTGRDASGKPTISAVSTAAARVQPSRRLIKDSKGNDAMTSYIVYTAAPLTLNHRVWFPGDDSSSFNLARRPIGVDASVDGLGVTRFYKVWFG